MGTNFDFCSVTEFKGAAKNAVLIHSARPRHLFAPDIIQAILEGVSHESLTADKLLAHSRLPMAWLKHG